MPRQEKEHREHNQRTQPDMKIDQRNENQNTITQVGKRGKKKRIKNK